MCLLVCVYLHCSVSLGDGRQALSPSRIPVYSVFFTLLYCFLLSGAHTITCVAPTRCGEGSILGPVEVGLSSVPSPAARPPHAHWSRRRGRKVVLVSGAGPISRSPRYIRSLLRRLAVVFASDSGGLTLGRTEGALGFSRSGSSSTLGFGRLFPGVTSSRPSWISASAVTSAASPWLPSHRFHLTLRKQSMSVEEHEEKEKGCCRKAHWLQLLIMQQ
ncbi:hypothetical protein GQ55_4G192500 [Panicum hallii var. hallii]|uniref:Secreted protein n=1 Tax=Panicum hallii var. hallii TaxID=1504633 RepID=A0A2T7DYZ0_9POAL|nr:hypothetical protein GQ55_4G192500 [Panicum hallii var. hallii]